MVVHALVGFINVTVFTGCSLTSYIIMNFKPEVAMLCSKAASSLLFIAYCVFCECAFVCLWFGIFFFWVPSFGM